jgi:hypothetical protein
LGVFPHEPVDSGMRAREIGDQRSAADRGSCGR